MGKLWRGTVRTVFWSYERGSWPYDVMVVLIILFVLVTPRHWFHDQAQNTALANNRILLVARDAGAHTETYRIDSQVLSPSAKTKSGPEFERKIHEILGGSVADLKGRLFQIRRISPVRGEDGSILYYDVEVKR